MGGGEVERHPASQSRGGDRRLRRWLAQQAVPGDVQDIGASGPTSGSNVSGCKQTRDAGIGQPSSARRRAPAWTRPRRRRHRSPGRRPPRRGVRDRRRRSRTTGSVPRAQIRRALAPSALAQAATFAAWPPAASRIVAGVSPSAASRRQRQHDHIEVQIADRADQRWATRRVLHRSCMDHRGPGGPTLDWVRLAVDGVAFRTRGRLRARRNRAGRRRPRGRARVDDHHARAAPPENVEAAIDFERTVAESGAVPATIAVIDGVARIGVEPEQLERLAASRARR